MGDRDIMEKAGKLVERWKFSPSARNLKPSFIRTMLKGSSQPGVINFAGGLPAPELFPVDELKEVCTRVLDKQGRLSLQYSLSSGIQEMRELLAERASSDDYRCTPDEIQVTSGAQQALDMVGRVFIEPGSVVLTEEPTYLGAIQAFTFYRARFVSVSTDSDGMLPDDLEKKIKQHNPTFVYVVPDFQNPAGYSWSNERREALVDLARKYDVPVVDDNPYSELRFTGEKPKSLKAVGGQHVIQLGTFSKLISPGLRIGWIVADPEIAALCERMKQAADLFTNTFAQYVIYEFSKDGGLDRHIERIKAAYSKRRDTMIEALRENFNDGTTWTEPEGGLFLWVKLPEGKSANDLIMTALENKVAYVPGMYFFSEKPDDTTMRINFCNATEENIKEGVRRLARVFKEAK
jgi:DNA-binding transcriptional MocR family regulator